MPKLYSLKKSRKILHNTFALFQRKKNRMDPVPRDQVEQILRDLDTSVLQKNREGASRLAHELEEMKQHFLKKTFFDYIREFLGAISFAIVAAYIIRQFCFELYEVPTGSMRPTIQEQDRLIVSKTTFGFHDALLFKKPWLFNENQLVREGLIVFTVRGMEMRDKEALYFGFIPGVKQLVKRAPALPGDTLYFYGGDIYGVDKEGKPFTKLAQQSGLDFVEHIPIPSFEGETDLTGRISDGYYSEALFKQFQVPVARMKTEANGWTQGEFNLNGQWEKEDLQALKAVHDTPKAYADLWGIGNYALARLLSIKETKQFYQKEFPAGNQEGLILELHHTPNVTFPLPEVRRTDNGAFGPSMTPMTTLVPLKQKHFKRIMNGMTTARFYVRNGGAYRYTESGKRPQHPKLDAEFPNVPDGCYEFYRGTAYAVHIGGFRSELPKTHPLYATSPENIRTLFNLGTYFNQLFDPIAPFQPYNPQRFAYWKEGALNLMGSPLLLSGEKETENLIKSEKKKESQSGSLAPYIAFVDRGPPLKDNGQVDIDKIRHFGLKVPDDAIMGLGDNYAGSSDSRTFGFIPLDNLRGSPVFTFWPFSSRFGYLKQPGYAIITLPNMISWILGGVVVLIVILYTRRKANRSLFKS
jgi:signal peptidase I